MEHGTWPQQIRSAPRGKILRRLRELRRRSAPWRIYRSALALRLAKKVPRQRKRNVKPCARAPCETAGRFAGKANDLNARQFVKGKERARAFALSNKVCRSNAPRNRDFSYRSFGTPSDCLAAFGPAKSG